MNLDELISGCEMDGSKEIHLHEDRGRYLLLYNEGASSPTAYAIYLVDDDDCNPVDVIKKSFQETTPPVALIVIWKGDQVIFHDNLNLKEIRFHGENVPSRAVESIKRFLKSGVPVFLNRIFDDPSTKKDLQKVFRDLMELLGNHGIKSETLRRKLIIQLLILKRVEKLGFFNCDTSFLNTTCKKLAQAGDGTISSFWAYTVDLFSRMAEAPGKPRIKDHLGREIINFNPAIILDRSDCEGLALDDHLFFIKDKKAKQPTLLDSWNVVRGQEGILDEDLICHLMEYSIPEGKKRKSGSYYTPYEWAYLTSKRTLDYFYQENPDRGENPGDVEILDPAMGAGDFLAAMEGILVEKIVLKDVEVRGEQADLNTLRFKFKLNHVLSRNLHGVDVNPLAIHVTRSRFFLNLIKHCKYMSPTDAIFKNFTTNLENADFLTTDMKSKKFDLVIGNPPYLMEVRKNQEIFRKYKSHPALKEHYEPKMDIFYLFIARSLETMKPSGILGFIVQEYWLNRFHAKKLRKNVFSNTKSLEFIFFKSFKVFQTAPGHHSMLLFIGNTVPLANSMMKIINIKGKKLDGDALMEDILLERKEHTSITNIRIEDAFDKEKDKFYANGLKERAFFEKIHSIPSFFLQPEEIQIGINIPQPFARIKGKLEGIFVIPIEEARNMELTRYELELLKPFHEASGLDQCQYEYRDKHVIIYTTNENMKLMEENPEKYPNLRAHLDAHADRITSDHKPYGLHRPRQPEWFESTDKIIGVRKTKKPKFSVVTIPYYMDQSGVFMRILHEKKYSPYYICEFFNSTIATQLFFSLKTQGNQLQIDKSVLLKIPIPKVDESTESYIAKLSHWKHALNIISKNESNQADFSELVQALDEIIKKFFIIIVFCKESPDFGKFTSEITNKIVTLPRLAIEDHLIEDRSIQDVLEARKPGIDAIQLENSIKKLLPRMEAVIPAILKATRDFTRKNEGMVPESLIPFRSQ
ncbi:MAG: Eco57I restriction-modification methylase domain-containing protein [Candidatus Hodarchaeota archaeon]